MTIGLPVDAVPVQRRTLLTVALALAVTSVRPELAVKWPNDLVVAAPPGDELGYRKAGGILAESHRFSESGEWVLLGIGLNVNWPEVPEHLAAIATSINRVVGHEVDREDLVAAVLVELDQRWLPMVEAPDGVQELLGEYRQRCATLGGRVVVQQPTSELVGIATDVTADGALVVTGDDGCSHVVTVGDVVHVRPSP
jgi:BirA family transcriptional regulator, biotin operon repressor / biotin---[acetyl-CoA-carboxylase] ligase